MGLKRMSKIGLAVDDTGVVYGRFGRPLKPCDNGNGYKYVCYVDEHSKKTKHVYIHRIIAETFLSNPNMYEEVNHIDGNKANNSVSNLEWCSRAMNMNHAYQSGLKIPTDKQREISRAYGETHTEQLRKGWGAWKQTDEGQRKIKAHQENITEIAAEVNKRKVMVINNQTETTEIYNSVSEAAKAYGMDCSMMSKYCRGKYKRKNINFKYLD